MKNYLKTITLLSTILTLLLFTACQNFSQPVESEATETEEEVISEVAEEESIPENVEELEIDLTDTEDSLETQTFSSYEYLDIPIPKAVITTAINAYLSGMLINLDNWGSWNGSNWHTQGSYILMPNGHVEPLNIPLSPTMKTVLRRYNGYINDLSTQSISVFIEGNKIRIRFIFESAGNELKVGCINRRKDKPCKAHLLNHSGQINNAQVNVWLTPVFTGSEVSFKDFEVKFDFDLQPDSWLLDKALSIVNWFIDTDSLIKQELTDGINDWLDDNNTIEGLAKDLNEEIIERATDYLESALGDKASNFVKDNLVITKLVDSGNYYVVTVRYPSPITRSSVRIPFVKGFRVIDSSKTMTCPNEVPFRASIYTKYKTKGRVWLVNEDGSTTRKLRWQSKRDTRANFTIKRSWDKPSNGHEYQGWSYMVVSFKDVFGVTHVKSSRKSHFSRTCEFGVTW